jgi:hypothetical protein
MTAESKEDRKPRSRRPAAARRPAKGAHRKPKRRSGAAGGRRLRPGELDDLVLSYMRAHQGDLPLGPGTVAREIGRSSGAVGNCLERLAKAKGVRRAGRRPRTYDLKGVGEG